MGDQPITSTALTDGFSDDSFLSAYVVLFPDLLNLHRFNLIATPVRQDILGV